MEPASLALQWLIGFTITLGFALLFSVPRRLLLTSAIIGAFGHLLRYMLRTLGAPVEVATFCGALLVGLAGFWRARRASTPRLVFTITGVISMVPGVPAYEMILLFRNEQVVAGLQAGFKVAIITGAIAVGLSAARVLTEIEWRRPESG